MSLGGWMIWLTFLQQSASVWKCSGWRQELLLGYRQSRGLISHWEPKHQLMQTAGDFTVDLHTDVCDLVAVVGNLRALRPLLSTLYRPKSRPLPDLSPRLWAARGGESMCSLLSRRRKRHRLLRLRQSLRYRNLEFFFFSIKKNGTLD